MFIDEAQRWLTGPVRPAVALPELPKGFDVEGRRAVVWQALEDMEAMPGRGPQRDWERAQETWTRPGFLETWLRAFVPAFISGIGRRYDWKVRDRAIDGVIHAGVKGEAFSMGADASRTMNAELKRLVDAAAQQVEDFYKSTSTTDEAISEWSIQNNLCTRTRLATLLGRGFCQLRGRDAVEFALCVGVELSVGPKDPWRMSAGSLRELLGGSLVYDDDIPEEYRTTVHRAAVSRLCGMGIAVHEEMEDDPLFDRFSLSPDALDLVSRVANEQDSRFRALVRALLDAERGRLTSDLTGQLAPDLTDLSYARSVAHEVRNLALPLSTALNALWTELGEDTPDHDLRKRLRGRIERSVNRLNEFATEAVKLSAAIDPEVFDLAGIIEEAIRATDAERNGRIFVHVDRVNDVRIDGPRSRWSMALVNLLRNSAQVRSGKGSVWISTTVDDGGDLHLYVDDDGPGVPEELRERIFEPGHSTRGGSGLGLADARRTAQMGGGSLVYEESPRGGARFHFSFRARQVR